MLSKLLSKLCKYTRAGGIVQGELTAETAHAMLTVRDDGIGFDPAAADRLFEVFARAVPSGMTDAGGLGLGLTIVRSIIDLHGGTISAHSEGPTKGATFQVQLPLIGSLGSACTFLSRVPLPHTTAHAHHRKQRRAGRHLPDLDRTPRSPHHSRPYR